MNLLENYNDIEKIVSLIKLYIHLFDDFENVYLFGSILDKKFPNDIDILLIYSKFSDNLICSTNNISNELQKILNFPIDLTVLSLEELKEVKFLNKIKLKYIRIK